MPAGLPVARKPVARKLRALAFPSLLALVPVPFLVAQTPQAIDGPAPTTYTLHVFTDLVQIPTLVLTEFFKPLPLLHADSFSITLDEGPKFHPTHVRLEDEDPLAIAVLIDASDSSNNLLTGLPAALARFAAESLRPHDRVSIYAVDCTLVRSALDFAADDPTIQQAVSNALMFPSLHGRKKHAACADKLILWGSIAAVATGLSTQSGRRVVIAVTEGKDTSSKIAWPVLRTYATSHSIAIFGLSDPGNATTLTLQKEDPFNALCQLTGGLVLQTEQHNFVKNISHLADLLRGRYILEFPRPGNAIGGEHDIAVTLVKKRAFIRPSGITVPARDAKRNDDPSNVPLDPTRVPVIGTRHILTPQP